MIGVMMGMAAAATTNAAATKPYRMLVPIGNQKAWFQPDDYPAIAITQKAEGMVHFAVQIGSDGKPTACRIVKGSGSEGLDAATCKALMTRAQFHPLIDKKGQPTTATFDQVVRWKLPASTTE